MTSPSGEGGRVRVLVLSRRRSGSTLLPAALPLGKAAMCLAEEGVEVIFGEGTHPGGRVDGWVVDGNAWGWREGCAVDAVYDRFPARGHPVAFAAAMAHVGHLPMGNPEAMTVLCSDKVASQAYLVSRGVDMPPLEAAPEHFAERLLDWGSAYAKPRYGAFGVGVALVHAGDPVPDVLFGGQEGEAQPTLLQRAVGLPMLGGEQVCGFGVRVLVQREVGGGWFANLGVARLSWDDPVANGARGAEVVALVDLWGEGVEGDTRALAVVAAQALAEHPDGEHLVEVGVDVVLDEGLRPWVIEVNGKPRGRLARLSGRDPERFGAAHVEAGVRPLRYVAWLARQGRA